MRSTPLAMLAGEGRLRVAPRPTGCLRRGLTPPLCGAFWRRRGEGRPAISPPPAGRTKGGRKAESAALTWWGRYIDSYRHRYTFGAPP
jgi:hypothetical protein